MLFNIGTSDCAVQVRLYGLNVELVLGRLGYFCEKNIFVFPTRQESLSDYKNFFFVNFFRLNGHFMRKHI